MSRTGHFVFQSPITGSTVMPRVKREKSPFADLGSVISGTKGKSTSSVAPAITSEPSSSVAVTVSIPRVKQLDSKSISADQNNAADMAQAKKDYEELYQNVKTTAEAVKKTTREHIKTILLSGLSENLTSLVALFDTSMQQENLKPPTDIELPHAVYNLLNEKTRASLHVIKDHRGQRTPSPLHDGTKHNIFQPK